MKQLYKYILASLFLICISFEADATYTINLHQSYNKADEVCIGRFIVNISGDAGPFDITIYPSINHIYTNTITEQRLGVGTGYQFMNPIEVESNFQAKPVLVIVDRFGCEYIYDEALINCDCEAVHIDHTVVTSPNAPDYDQVDGMIIYHPTDCFSNDGRIRFVSNVLQNAITPITMEWSDPNIEMGYVFHSNIGIGQHTLTMTDDAGCSDEVTINFRAENRPFIAATVCPSCDVNNSGFIEFSASSTLFSEEWTVELDINWGTDLPPSAIEETTDGPYIGESSLSDLPPGTYCVTITEAKVDNETQEVIDACDHVECFTVESVAAEQELYYADPMTSNSCPFQPTGTFSVFVDGGVKFSDVPCFGAFYDYKFDWSHLQNSTTTPYIGDLAEGNYEVTITDFCGDQIMIPFTIDAFDEMTYNVDFTKGCDCGSELNISNVAGGEGNAINITVTGPSTELVRTVPNFAPDNKWDIGNLCQGLYTIRFEDAEGCFQEEEIFVETYPEMILEVTSFQNPCLVNSNFFEGNLNDILEGTIYNQGSINTTITWSDGQDYSTSSTFEWNDANAHSGGSIPNINQAMDLVNLSMDDFDGGAVNMPPTREDKVFELEVCTEFEPGLQCCETVFQNLFNNIEVRTQAYINGSPNNSNWQESGCECQLFVYCGVNNLVDVIERTIDYKDCDVLSNLTDNILDCGSYECYCNFPDKYQELAPIPDAFEPNYPLHCPDEEMDLEENVIIECSSECQYEIDCPDWNILVPGINWTCDCGPFETICEFSASGSPSGLVVSNGGCGQDITFEFDIDLEDVNCPRPLYVTTRIDGSTYTSDYYIGDFSIGNHTWTLDGSNSALIDQSYNGCAGELEVTFNYDQSTTQTLTFEIDFDNCQSLDITWTNMGDFSNRCTDPIELDFNGIDCPVNVEIYFVDGLNNDCSDASGTPLVDEIESNGMMTIDLNEVNGVTENMTMIIREVGSSQCQTYNIEELDLAACLCTSCTITFNAEHIPEALSDCDGSNITINFGCETGNFNVWSIPATTPNVDCSMPGSPTPGVMETLIENETAKLLSIVGGVNIIEDLETNDNGITTIPINQSGDSDPRILVVEWDCYFSCVSDPGIEDCPEFTGNGSCGDALICSGPSGSSQSKQRYSVQEIQDGITAKEIKFPTHLNRVRLCDQTEAYFFDQFINDFDTDNIMIIDQILIESFDDILEVEIQEEHLEVSVSDFISNSRNQIMLSKVTNINGYICNGTSSIRNLNSEETEDSAKFVEDISVNPNPFFRDINVSYLSNEIGKTSVRIYTSSGELIKKVDLKTQIGKNLHTIGLEQIPSGLILVQIILPSGEANNFKVIKVEGFED